MSAFDNFEAQCQFAETFKDPNGFQSNPKILEKLKSLGSRMKILNSIFIFIRGGDFSYPVWLHFNL